jgi:hypothetical protein
MTLRTIETEFSERLQNQPDDEYPLDLTLDGPAMNQLHPRLIWASLQLKHNPTLLPEKIKLEGWFYECFPDPDAAKIKYPDIKLSFVGKPWSLHQFLSENHQAAIIHFPGLGTIVLSRQELDSTFDSALHHHLLPIWMNYALSPELWGKDGKWTRFNSRLTQLFQKHRLLRPQGSLGYYPLEMRASKLAEKGFLGTHLEKSYLIVLPWTFSLTSLEKLEQTIQQEF